VKTIEINKWKVSEGLLSGGNKECGGTGAEIRVAALQHDAISSRSS
jgi:hypothetical protein